MVLCPPRVLFTTLMLTILLQFGGKAIAIYRIRFLPAKL